MVCHHYRCIFVHIPKCAGQSIEELFLEALGLNWELRAPLLLRANDKPALGPPRLGHLRASEYVHCKYVTPKQFSDYYKFTVARNPWDRMVSLYKYLAFSSYHGIYTSLSFKKFVMSEFPRRIWKNQYWFARPQYEYVVDSNGECLVDFIGRFETLQQTVDEVCRQTKLPSTHLPHVNKSRKQWPRMQFKRKKFLAFWILRLKNKLTPSFDAYPEYYDAESREYVAELYRQDIEAFGYRFAPANECAAEEYVPEKQCVDDGCTGGGSS
jgi:hypothetical protein